ncbi:MAG: helix-turn-helix domain-containing protein [Acidimicrobiia bacterium]
MTPNGYMDEIAVVIRRRRRELGIDQETTAQLAGVSRKSVSEIERGKRTVRLDVLMRVVDVLGLRMEIS